MTDLAVGPSRSSAAGEGGFTDAGISNRRRFERELVAWAPDESDVAADGSGLLEDPAARAKKGAGARGGNNRAWDQFAANKSMFGVDTTFDETQYTTAIDRAAVGITEREAARIAAEIQNTASSNIHVQEERGQRTTVDYDEEDRYGAVIGTGAAAGGAHQKEKEGPTTKDGAALPAKPAWGSARAPEGALAKPTVRSASPPAPKPTNGGTATNAASVPKPNATNATNANASDASTPDASAKPKSTLNANAKPFTLSASAAAFVPGKKPAAAAAPVSPMLGAYPPAGVGGFVPGMGMPPAMMMAAYGGFPGAGGFPGGAAMPPGATMPGPGGRGAGRGGMPQNPAHAAAAAAAAAQYAAFAAPPGRPPPPPGAPEAQQ